MNRVLSLIVVTALAALASGREVPKPAPKADEKKAEPKKEPGKGEESEEIDVHKTAERIAENAQKAGDRLKDKDPGEDTRKIQQEVLKDIDALLRKAQQPPPPSDMPPPMPPMMPPPKDGMPPPKDGMPPPKDGMSGGMPPPKSGMPMGNGGGGMPPPKAGGSGTGGKPSGRPDRGPRRERRPQGGSPTGTGDPTPKGGPGGKEPTQAKAEPKDGPMGGEKPMGDGPGDKFGKMSPRRQNDKLADLYKDVWGNLPDRMRQEMDLYYREQFMPRYSELLRQYYAVLAEQRKKGSEDR